MLSTLFSSFTTHLVFLVVRLRSTEIQHLPKNAELSKVVQETVSGLEHQILDHLQRYKVTIVVLL